MKRQYILGMVENVELEGETVLAKIDTGASRSSIDEDLAVRLGMTEIIKEREVRSSHGRSVRNIVRGRVKIGSRIIPTTFSLADRKDLKFDLILGKNFLWRGFIIDTRRSYLERRHNESCCN
ncbi:hypothetical protein HNV12_03320 [Methanococcoides sp. SA1]|nr:hypothetical protein [Methanococcoides sp. SA1]